jgi:hypothetical protein
LRQLEAEHVAIEGERAIDIGDLQMHMPDPQAWIGRSERPVALAARSDRLVGHERSPVAQAQQGSRGALHLKWPWPPSLPGA